MSGPLDWSSLELSPDDRVLVMAVPPEADIRALASRAALVVCVGAEADVLERRRVLSDLENVMLIAQPEDDVLPFREGFFSCVLKADS